MLHPSTRKLIDKLDDMTAARKIDWREDADNTCVYDTEGYRVKLSRSPTAFVLFDSAGRELERTELDELAAVSRENGDTYVVVIEQMFAEARRQAVGTDAAIDRIVGALDLDGDGIPDIAADGTPLAPDTVEGASADVEPAPSELVDDEDPSDPFSAAAITAGVAGLAAGATGLAASVSDNEAPLSIDETTVEPSDAALPEPDTPEDVSLSVSDPVSWAQPDEPVDVFPEPQSSDLPSDESSSSETTLEVAPELAPGTNYLDGIPTEDGMVSAFVSDAPPVSERTVESHVNEEPTATDQTTVVEHIESETESVLDGASGLLSGLGDSVADTASSATETATDAVADVTDTVSDIVESATEVGSGLKDGAENVVGNLQERLTDVTETASETGSGLLGGLREKAAGLTSATLQSTAGVSSAIAATAEDVVSSAGNTVQNLTDAASSAVSDGISNAQEAVETVTPSTEPIIEEASNDDEEDEQKPVFRYNPWM